MKFVFARRIAAAALVLSLGAGCAGQPIASDAERYKRGSRLHAFGAALSVGGLSAGLAAAGAGVSITQAQGDATVAYAIGGAGLLMLLVGAAMSASGDAVFDAPSGPASDARRAPVLNTNRATPGLPMTNTATEAPHRQVFK